MSFKKPRHAGPADDIFSFVRDVLTWTKTRWMQKTYPFASFGRGVSIEFPCDLRRKFAPGISIGDRVYMASDTWVVVPEHRPGDPPAIVFGNGCKIGRRCMISGKNGMRLEDDVLLGPCVLVTDHGHEFSDIDLPIVAQGLTPGGKLTIEKGCWIGHGAAVVCTSGTMVVGRNSVIAANAVLTRSVPPYSVVAGNPGRIVKRYDPEAGAWVKVSELVAEEALR